MDGGSPPPDFESVAEEISGPLRRYLARLTGNSATADDLLQETLLKIARALPGFEGRSSIKTWAFTIATRVATDHFRRPQNRAKMVEVDETSSADEEETDRRLVVDEMNACVREVIESLPEDYRTALVLHDLEGQTAPQVAAIVGCSIPTAKIRIHRARHRLRQALDKECRFYRDEDNVFRCDRKPHS